MMIDAARAPIEPFMAHGGRVDLARAAFSSVKDWVDLSTGIAPWAYPLDLAAMPIRALPDPALLAELEANAAAAFRVADEQVVALPGSDMALRLLGTIVPGPAGWAVPGYSGHQSMWPKGGARAFRRDMFDGDISGLQAIALARPNNPDGWIAEEALLEKSARQLAARNGHLIVDEAFVDATPDLGLAGRDWPGLIVLRSFGKFFGLAGLRLGFVIAPPPIVVRLRALIGDWPVSAPALHAGIAAYGDLDWQSTQRVRLNEGAQRMAALLADNGIAVAAQTAFFTLIHTYERDALFSKLANAGLLTRPFTDQPNWLRIGLPGNPQAWSRLADVLSQWRPK